MQRYLQAIHSSACSVSIQAAKLTLSKSMPCQCQLMPAMCAYHTPSQSKPSQVNGNCTKRNLSQPYLCWAVSQ